MKKRVFTEKQLQEAAGKAREKMLEALPHAGEELPPFRSEFREKMEGLYNMERRAARRQALRRQVAAAAAMLVIAISCLFAVSPEARAAAVNWVKTVSGSWTFYSFNGKKLDRLPDCKITWIPEGLELVSEDKLTTDGAIVYQDPRNPKKGFVLMYFLLDETSIYVDNLGEEYTTELVSVGDYTGDLHISKVPEGNYEMVWSDPDRGVGYAISSSLEPDVILHIAESVVLVNSDKK